MRIARTSPLKNIQSIKSYCKRRFSPVPDVTGPLDCELAVVAGLSQQQRDRKAATGDCEWKG
jgi:hypothetical protein